MKAQENNPKLDEIISKAIGREIPEFDFSRWKRTHQSEIEIFKSQTANRSAHFSVLLGGIWMAIWRAKVGRIAVAACIIVAAVIALRPFSRALDGTTAAYAKVEEAVRNVPWMRIHYASRMLDPNGNERPGGQSSTDIWYSFNSQILIQRYSFGGITFKDYSKQEVYNYNPDSRKIVLCAMSGDTMPMPFGADSPWSWLERNVQQMMPFGGDVTRKAGQYDGREVDVFEIVATPKRGVAAVRGKIFVERMTSLPIAEERTYIDTRIDKPQLVEKGTFEYPGQGPADIYDVGLSRDVPTVDSRPLPPWEEINHSYETCRRTGPERYIAVVTSELRIRGAPVEYVDICYVGGKHSREERHFLFQPGPVGVQWREQAAEIGNTFDSILKWAQARKARGEISITIHHEKCYYNSRRQDNGTWKTAKQMLKGRELTAEDHWHLCPIVSFGWPQIAGYADVIQDNYARENNLIRVEAQGKVFYLNPERDYICQTRTDTSGQSTEVKEYARTAEGKWYPRRIEGPGKANTFYLETTPVFPEGIFDPNNLPKEDK